MFRQVGSFDALISTAGPTYVGPWKNLTDKEFRKGVEGKMMGQINLVLIGQHYINSLITRLRRIVLISAIISVLGKDIMA